MSNVKTSLDAQNQPSHLAAVICRLSSVYLLEPLIFDGKPIYYKMDGLYGYLMPSGDKVLFFYYDNHFDRLLYNELEGWSVLNGI
jgi:hypothetical protein